MGKMKTKAFLFLMILITTVNNKAQVYRNLDFEKHSSNGQAKGWLQGGNGYRVFIDTTIFFSGKSSLCIQKEKGGGIGVATSSFPIADSKGKQLKYTGYIKTDSLTKGHAGLWWRVDGKNGTLNFDNMYNRGPKGTTDWKKYSVEFKIDENATNINFGVLFGGDGKAWFDNLQIELDGKVYEQITSSIFEITKGNLQWLRSNVYEFETSDPKHNMSDLGFLRNMIGDAKIVSLGEGTHGTSEFFKMKHRITKYLAEEMGFTVFAIEANMPEAKAINDYILYGKGDSKKALEGLYFWTWNTQEVLDMIEWMREFNKSKNGRIEFWGFDMQYPSVAVKNVKEFIKENDTSYYKKANSNYEKVIASLDEIKKMKSVPGNVLFEPILEKANEVLAYVESKSDVYKNKLEKEKVDWIIQNARIVVQSIECLMKGTTSRDESMANNIEWILNKFGKDTKIVLWAHNGHVRKTDIPFDWKPMGNYLKQKYDKEMVVIGFGFYEGNYTAFGKNGIDNYSTSLPQSGSLEWILHSTGIVNLVLDLRKLSNSPLTSLTKYEIEFRSIGALAIDEAFITTNITQDYDAIIYFDKTTPSACFRKLQK